jgi:hypothetical protein
MWLGSSPVGRVRIWEDIVGAVYECFASRENGMRQSCWNILKSMVNQCELYWRLNGYEINPDVLPRSSSGRRIDILQIRSTKRSIIFSYYTLVRSIVVAAGVYVVSMQTSQTADLRERLKAMALVAKANGCSCVHKEKVGWRASKS